MLDGSPLEPKLLKSANRISAFTSKVKERAELPYSYGPMSILASALNSDTARTLFDTGLGSDFEAPPWTSGEAGVILGMNFKWDWEAGMLELSQSGAI